MTATTAAESSLAAAQRAGRQLIHRRWPRRLLIALGIVVLLVIVIRLILDPVAAHFTRKGLAQMDGFQGDFESVHVTVFGPGYTIRRLKMKENPGGSWKSPIFYAESVHVGVDWRRLFHAQLVAAARIVEPKIIVINKKEAEKAEKAKMAPDLSKALQQAIPLKVARVEVLDGEFLFRDATAPRHPELWVHDLDLAVENLPTRAKLAEARPTTLSGRGTVGKSGALTVFASADPLASPLAFAGRFDLSGLKVAELYDFI